MRKSPLFSSQIQHEVYQKRNLHTVAVVMRDLLLLAPSITAKTCTPGLLDKWLYGIGNSRPILSILTGLSECIDYSTECLAAGCLYMLFEEGTAAHSSGMSLISASVINQRKRQEWRP